jgi:predicted nucleotidyltransferase
VQKASLHFPIVGAAYFGSYANGQAHEDSDLDLLVEYEPIPVSVLTTISLKHFLEEELGKPVDVVSTPIPSGAIIEVGRAVSVI